MRLLVLGFLITSLACASSAPSTSRQLIDLTHPFDERTIYWPTEEGFVLERGNTGIQPGGYYYEAHRFRGAEHGGTHLDAPIHFHEGRWHVDEIPVERLMGSGVRVDIHAQAAADRDYLVDVDDLLHWEEHNGRIPDGGIVLLDTGFARYWPDRPGYMGTDARGAEGVAALHFPGLDPEAARWLAEERKVHAVGIDTPSIDHGPSKDFAAHVALCAANVAIFENVASMSDLPARDFEVVALPMKIGSGSGAPLRIVAVIRRPPAER
jgi:kynurenine formamidase